MMQASRQARRGKPRGRSDPREYVLSMKQASRQAFKPRRCAFKDEASLEAGFKAGLEAGLEAGFQSLEDILA